MRGWTFDPSAPATSINVHVYVDGRFYGPVAANVSRADVARSYPDAGAAHGFAGSVVAAPGKHAVCVYAVNTGPGYTNPLLGCRTVTVAAYTPHNPVGGLDALTVSVLSVDLRGWAFDPDVPTAPLRVHIYMDGRPIAGLTADQQRDDVLRAYPGAGAPHGFALSRSLPAGTHEICAYGINQAAGTANPKLGCRTVTLGGPPVGALESVSTTAGQVRVRGWTLDPDTVDPTSVHVYVNGAYKGAATADLPRPELATSAPASEPRTASTSPCPPRPARAPCASTGSICSVAPATRPWAAAP